jgi:hypothetical protein
MRRGTRGHLTILLGLCFAAALAVGTRATARSLFDMCNKDCTCGTLSCGGQGCNCTTVVSGCGEGGGGGGCAESCGGGTKQTLCCADKCKEGW